MVGSAKTIVGGQFLSSRLALRIEINWISFRVYVFVLWLGRFESFSYLDKSSILIVLCTVPVNDRWIEQQRITVDSYCSWWGTEWRCTQQNKRRNKNVILLTAHIWEPLSQVQLSRICSKQAINCQLLRQFSSTSQFLSTVNGLFRFEDKKC